MFSCSVCEPGHMHTPIQYKATWKKTIDIHWKFHEVSTSFGHALRIEIKFETQMDTQTNKQTNKQLPNLYKDVSKTIKAFIRICI